MRGGAALVVAALCADGESNIYCIEHIDRGYENLEKALSSIGANIKRSKMKEQQKRNRRNEKHPKKQTEFKIDSEFLDLGIEPPKIYRESQKRITQAQEKKSRQSSDLYSMTRLERRQRESNKRKRKTKHEK